MSSRSITLNFLISSEYDVTCTQTIEASDNQQLSVAHVRFGLNIWFVDCLRECEPLLKYCALKRVYERWRWNKERWLHTFVKSYAELVFLVPSYIAIGKNQRMLFVYLSYCHISSATMCATIQSVVCHCWHFTLSRTRINTSYADFSRGVVARRCFRPCPLQFVYNLKL